eukprot:gnl/TRDRNA2_/TRDRNA2_177678_c4_seq28.p1 gnl/TRDRNA2_/TRDRNA2_177678_c4~~gnl/TRDRNA2_/TRDRNA2_177678_c4_seq28.p1  ORF type:complete len:505 (+),score=88.94 gnl/TRDRNA2_/TRDRNA2_177678_c4_seq28:50-1564(+)
MSTADEIRAQIASQQQLVKQAEEAMARSQKEKDEALVRQELRKQLAELQATKSSLEYSQRFYDIQRGHIDRDEPSFYSSDKLTKNPLFPVKESAIQSELDCDKVVVSGELQWRIKGFSWLHESLQQFDDDCASSSDIEVCGHEFCLMYHPTRGEMGDHSQRGSLVIYHSTPPRNDGVAFRYKLWIKSKERGFVQWGSSGAEFMQEDADGRIFGPDVCRASDVPNGLFGMSHEQLMNSEWVVDDVLTAKLRVEVRPLVPPRADGPCDIDEVLIPPPVLADKLMALLDSGSGCDVTFIVQGESIRAHGQILSAASDVLQRQLACGMQESISKEIIVEDCEPKIFGAFVRYMYSESLDSLQNFIAGKSAEPSSSDPAGNQEDASEPITKMSILQQLLAVSHKYQVNRVQAWCERELCKFLSIEDVCSVLRQAHLYEAKKLEKKCLEFIKAHRNDVVKSVEFASLTREWPELCLKIMLHMGDVSDASAATAMDVQRSLHKRKRESPHA